MASDMDDATRLKVYDMIMGYAFAGSVPTDTDLSLLFLSVKAEIDEDRKREEELHSVRSRVGKAGIEKRWKNARIAKIANDSKNSNCYTCYDLLSNQSKSDQLPTEIKERKERSKEKREYKDIDNFINNNNNINNNIEEEDKEEEITSVRPQVLPQTTGGAVAPAAAPATEASYLASVMDHWNERMKGVGIPSIVAIGGNRRAHVLARMREYGAEAVAKVIDMVATSRFLQGSNNRGFVATFDWVIKPANFIKILEGNYNEQYDRNERNALDAIRSVINESNGTDTEVLNW
jgi:hypothetical protein